MPQIDILHVVVEETSGFLSRSFVVLPGGKNYCRKRVVRSSCGDWICWKTFNPFDSLIARGILNIDGAIISLPPHRLSSSSQVRPLFKKYLSAVLVWILRSKYRGMSIRFTPTGWCQIKDGSRCSLRGAQWKAESSTITYTPAPNVAFECEKGVIAFNNEIALLEHKNPLYRTMLKFLSNCYVSTTLTKQPSTHHLKYLREFWSSAEVDAATNTITFTLSCSSKPLSFYFCDFSTINGLKYSENYEALPLKETMRTGLATLRLVDEKNPQLTPSELINSSLLIWGLNVDIGNILFSDLVAKIVNGKKGREVNICYTRRLKSNKQVVETQHAEETVAIGDPTKGLDASESTEEVANQPSTATTEKLGIRIKAKENPSECERKEGKFGMRANQMLKELEILSTNQRGAVRALLDCKVVKVLVHEGMKVEKDQPIFVVAVYPKQMRPLPLSECEKSRVKKCLDEESSRPTGIFPIEDVMPCIFPIHALLPYQKNARNSTMEPTFDSTVDLLNSHDNFKKFDFVEDHSDHLFAAHNFFVKYGLSQPTKHWIDKLNEDRRILCRHLPDTIFVRMYKSRPNLLRAAIVGPEGTPYHNGLFFFDFCFPFNYPNTPPGSKCKTFYWVDHELLSEYYKEEVFKLLQKVNFLQTKINADQHKIREMERAFDFEKSTLEKQVLGLKMQLKESKESVGFYRKVVVIMCMIVVYMVVVKL
ncbi:retrovirus-related pol polyprotein from transposon TNT 1-94 [Tanacetum coccineum]